MTVLTCLLISKMTQISILPMFQNCGGSRLKIYLFIWGFTLLSTQYRSYQEGELEGQRKPVHTVGQGSVL